MRNITKILISFVLLLFLCVSSFAQNKIAVVDSNAFYNEKSGIKELIVANKILEDEFKSTNEELRALNKRLDELVIYVKRFETTDFSESYFKENKEKHEKMYSEIQALPSKIKEITDKTTPQIEKRKLELVEPINKKIGDKAKEFAKKNEYAMILDISKENNFFICELCHDNDVTNEFIKFCNEEFEKEKSRK